MWAKGGEPDEFLPEGFGLGLQDSYLMLMVIYEGVSNSLVNENTGLVLSYRYAQPSKPIQTAHRLGKYKNPDSFTYNEFSQIIDWSSSYRKTHHAVRNEKLENGRILFRALYKGLSQCQCQEQGSRCHWGGCPHQIFRHSGTD